MKKIFVSLISLSLLLVSCSSFQLAASPSPTPDALHTPWDDRTIFKNGLVESQHHVLNELKGATVYHIEFNIRDDISYVSGHEEVRYTNTETAALHEVELRLFPNILGGKMDVSSVSVDDKSIEAKYDLENSLMIIPFSTPLQPNQSVILKMDFVDKLPLTVEQNYGVL